MIRKLFKSIQPTLLEEISHLFLWIPVFIGCGAYIYLKYFFKVFTPIPMILLGLFLILSIVFRKKHYFNLINIALLCFTLGVCSAEIGTKRGDLDLIKKDNIQAYVEGRVSKVIRKPKSASIIVELNHQGMEDAIGSESLKNVKKVSVKLTNLSEIPNKNDKIYVKAILNSPTPAVMKGAYNFQKDAYFKQIGAFGYAKTKLYFLSRVNTPYLDKVRNKIRNSIDKSASNNENGQLMKALMLGEKKATSKETTENFRASGIAHLLSISGLHICLIFGFIFLLLRYLFALNQKLTLNHDIKKISATIAIITTLFYVILVGYPMPTIRAFIMIFVIFLGILFNRRALSMRNLAIAGILILLVAPQSILSASFQMSFAAVIALIAAYEFISKKGIVMIGFKGYFAGIMFTSLIAIFATAPFAIYNFQNFSPYGIITNALVMPIVSIALIPFVVLSYILLPIGLAWMPLTIVNLSVNSIAYMAEYIANLKYSYLLIPAIPGTTLALFIFGGLFICLFKHKLRLAGVFLLILSVITAFTMKDLPDVIISPDAEIIAVRNQNSLLTFSDIENETFISGIMARINGQTEILPFSDNDLITCVDTCVYEKDGVIIDLSTLKAKPHAQQIYIENGVSIIKDIF